MRIDCQPERAIADLRALADLTGGPGGARRLCWSDEWVDARGLVRERLAELPVEVDVDEAGNVWARLAGARPETVVIGSHVDSVPNGGWLDGALGVMAALETLRTIAAAGTPPCTVTLVDWADEEGARFGRSLFGSSAACGTLDPAAVRDLRDAGGERLADVLARHGVDVETASAAGSRLADVRAYLELHIEQGPVLLDGGRLACAVSGTVGVERHLMTFTGQAAHAGSTPMRLRQDSLAAAARAALEIRESAINHDGVGTVGRMQSSPGVITAVAGSTEMQLDQRHLDSGELAEMFAEARDACHKAAEEFNCTVQQRDVFRATPTPFDATLVELVRASVQEAGGDDGEPIPSGPLHDATEIGRVVPTAMIFAQSDPPISHASIEDSPQAALEVAIDAYGRTVESVLARAGQMTSEGAV
jgi:N-carbamoyl-L-amino-acid hydrolase